MVERYTNDDVLLKKKHRIIRTGNNITRVLAKRKRY